MLIDDLPEDVRRSFRAAYDLKGEAAWELAFSREKASAAAQEVPVPEAFLDAVRLQSAISMVYSADTRSEYKADIAAYDALASELNEKYGDIVVTSSESSDLGLRGRRRTAYSTVTETVRNTDGEETVTVFDAGAETRREDEAIRSGAAEAEGYEGLDEPRDRTDELAATLGMQTLEFAELFGGGWRENDGPIWHDYDSEPSDGEAVDPTPWMIAGAPPQLMIRVFYHGVFLAVPECTRWDFASGPEYRASAQRYLGLHDFEESGSRVVGEVLRRRRRQFRYCRFCRRPTPPESRFSADVCAGCATRWYGVVY